MLVVACTSGLPARAGRLPDRMGIVKTDKPITIRAMKRKRVVQPVRFRAGGLNAPDGEANPVFTLGIDYQHLAIQIQEHIQSWIPPLAFHQSQYYHLLITYVSGIQASRRAPVDEVSPSSGDHPHFLDCRAYASESAKASTPASTLRPNHRTATERLTPQSRKTPASSYVQIREDATLRVAEESGEQAMSTLTSPVIREALLAELNTRPQFGGEPDQNSVLNAAARRLGIAQGPPDLERALLTQWNELFRTGLLAWGTSLSCPGPPSFHLTEPGKQALANWTRDPSNPAGYLRHLDSIAPVDPVVRSYISEALECFVADHFRAAAVMTGVASEKLILNLRDATRRKLDSLGRRPPKGMRDWRPKAMSDSLHQFLNQHKDTFPHPLRDEFEARWSVFTQQIRATRNEAGHPASIDAVTREDAHASLLIFPGLAKLAGSLDHWVVNDLV